MHRWLPTLSFVCDWRDLIWGVRVDAAKRCAHLSPFPCLGVALQWPAAKVVVQTVPHPEHRRILIVAHSYPQAREYARRSIAKDRDWRYVTCLEHLAGYRDVDLVTLEGWQSGRDWAFVTAVRRLERENAIRT